MDHGAAEWAEPALAGGAAAASAGFMGSGEDGSGGDCPPQYDEEQLLSHEDLSSALVGDDAAQVTHFLLQSKLSQFCDALLLEGFDDMTTLREAEDEELKAMGMGMGHIKRLRRCFETAGYHPKTPVGAVGAVGVLT